MPQGDARHFTANATFVLESLKKKKIHLVYLEDSEALCYYCLLQLLHVGSISEFNGSLGQPQRERRM